MIRNTYGHSSKKVTTYIALQYRSMHEYGKRAIFYQHWINHQSLCYLKCLIAGSLHLKQVFRNQLPYCNSAISLICIPIHGSKNIRFPLISAWQRRCVVSFIVNFSSPCELYALKQVLSKENVLGKELVRMSNPPFLMMYSEVFGLVLSSLFMLQILTMSSPWSQDGVDRNYVKY